MSDDDITDPAATPFDATAALQQLRRALRDLKLAERGAGFELRGKRVVELAADPARITARLARKWASTPEWDTRHVGSTVEQRKLVDDIRQRLARWDREE